MKTVIGVVLHDDLEMLEKHGHSWFSNGLPVIVCTSGKKQDRVSGRVAERMVVGDVCHNTGPYNGRLGASRNIIIQKFLEGDAEWLLMIDSDVTLLPEGLTRFINAAHVHKSRNKRLGIAVTPAALRDHHPDPSGKVLECANECWLMHRSMLEVLPAFSQAEHYYSTDSFYALLAHLAGFDCQVLDIPNVYVHDNHASQRHDGVTEKARTDTAGWLARKDQMWQRMRHLVLTGERDVSTLPPHMIGKVTTLNSLDEVLANRQVLRGFPPLHAEHLFKYTPPQDVQALLAIMSLTSGRILETGCNQGHTTLQLGLAFPSREVLGVDCSTLSETGPQAAERVEAHLLGFMARNLRNVTLLDMSVTALTHALTADIDAAFIDDDHTYDGVRKSTEKVLELMTASRKNGSKRPSVIAWHDYAPDYDTPTMPVWIGVGDYVRKEMATKYPTYWVRHTRVAFSLIT